MTNINNKHLHTTEDGITRCWWGNDHLDYRNYHDEEWGRPVADDFQLFEKICLEGFQSGLSWKIADYDEDNVASLLQNSGIIRHRGKIEATINNAHRALEVVDEFGSLAAYIWKWEPASPELHVGKGDYSHPVPSITSTSQLLSKDLKNRGWKFFGPTTAYAFMQAMGLVNDHMEGCAFRKKVETLRSEFEPPSK